MYCMLFIIFIIVLQICQDYFLNCTLNMSYKKQTLVIYPMRQIASEHHLNRKKKKINKYY